MSRRKIAAVAVVAAGVGAALWSITAFAEDSVGAPVAPTPDVIVGVLPDLSNHGSTGTIQAYSIGTTSCNVGSATLDWIANTNQHPVIGGNLYQVKDGRLRQVGYSWLKHGFLALAGNACGLGCQNPGTGSKLGIGCSDPYNSGLNGGRSMGLRRQVNATRGYYPNNWLEPACAGGGCTTVEQRMQAERADLTRGNGEKYFYEAQYVTADDAMAGNGLNNASYREVSVNGSFSMSFTGPGTVQAMPAIYAWKGLDPQVHVAAVGFQTTGGPAPAADDRFPTLPDPPELLHVGTRIHDEGGGVYRWEIAVHNLNSHRAVRSIAVPIPANATVLTSGFHRVFSHSGEDISIFGDGFESGDASWWGVDWVEPPTGAVGPLGGSATWMTRPYETSESADAIEWGRTFSFWLTVDAQPGANDVVTLGLYRPGAPASVTARMFPEP